MARMGPLVGVTVGAALSGADYHVQGSDTHLYSGWQPDGQNQNHISSSNRGDASSLQYSTMDFEAVYCNAVHFSVV